MDAAAALWDDDAHVEATRALYARKYEIATRLLGGRPGHRFHRAARQHRVAMPVGHQAERER